MSGLPTPPDAYWASVPWWAWLGFLTIALIIMVIVGPWMVQRARQRPSAILSREQSIAVREAAHQVRQDAERVRIEADRDQGWNTARGCLPVMHQLWHDLAGVIQERNALLGILQRVLDGRLPADAARDRLLDYEPRPKPEPLPELDAVEPKRPGETKYA